MSAVFALTEDSTFCLHVSARQQVVAAEEGGVAAIYIRYIYYIGYMYFS